MVGALMGDYKAEELLSQGGLMQQLVGAVVERALEAEMTEHLGYAKGERSGGGGNSRNGTSRKMLKGDNGEFPIQVPRDRAGSFAPQLVKKHQTRLPGFDDKIIAMYARGMSVRDIQAQLEELYGVDVGSDLISRVTDSVLDEVKAWQARPLDPVYPIVYLDALVVKVRDGGLVKNKHVYLALGVNMQGKKEILGMWLQRSEGAKFWHQVLTELRNRGLKDMLIVCTDGLSGFPEAIEAVYPEAVLQTCIVHLLRASIRYVTWKDRRAVLADLKPVYTAPTEEAALDALVAFNERWQHTYPMIGQSWEAAWERVIPLFAFPSEIRRVIYTTNAIESVNRQIRKVIKTKGHFPNDDAVFKILFLALHNASKKWTMPIRDWSRALHQLAILFPGRLSV
ncbi:IS256 family transposase [Haliangium ochraceum]|nr:IS256 family transposase [Haliangium ochraceum]